MIKIGDRVRDLKYGVTGKVISIHDTRGQGALAVIRLDKEDPILGKVTTAWEGEVEIENHRTSLDIDSKPGHFAEKALATRTGTTGRESE